MQIATLAGKTLDFDDNFSLELLDRTGEPMLSCRAITIHGRRLIEWGRRFAAFHETDRLA